MSKSETKKHKEDHGEVDAASDLSATPGEARSSLSGEMKRKEYEREVRVFQGELVAMQKWVKTMCVNRTILVEIALALLIARGGVLTSLLGTQPLTGRQWLTGAVPALVLLILWELGKLIARRGAEPAQAVLPSDATPAEAAAA